VTRQISNQAAFLVPNLSPQVAFPAIGFDGLAQFDSQRLSAGWPMAKKVLDGRFHENLEPNECGNGVARKADEGD
jgi:hypothetical protein